MKPTELAKAIYELYPPFRPWDDATLEAWTNSVVEKCGRYTPEVRADAFSSLTEVTHKEKPPQVATIVAHCKDAKGKLWKEEQASRLPVAQQGEPKTHDERTRLADDLVMGPEGRQAAKECWILSLHDYARNHGRLPPPAEFGALKRKAKEFDEAYAKCVKGNGLFAASVLESLGAKMLKKRNELIDRVLGSR